MNMNMNKTLMISSILVIASLALTGCSASKAESYDPTIDTKPSDGFVFTAIKNVKNVPLLKQGPEEANGWSVINKISTPTFNTVDYKNENNCTFSVASQISAGMNSGSGDFYASKARAYSISSLEEGGLINESMLSVKDTKGKSEFISGEYSPKTVFDANSPKGIKELDGNYTTFIAVRVIDTEVKVKVDPNAAGGENRKHGAPTEAPVVNDLKSFPEVIIKYTCNADKYKAEDAIKMISETTIDFYSEAQK